MGVKLVSSGYQLAEGPLWSPGLSSFFFVDITGKQLLALKEGKVTRYPMEEMVSAIALTDDDGKLLCAIGNKVALFSLATGCLETVVEVPLPSGMRWNDGKVSPDGAFLVGSMEVGDDRTDNGRLFSIEGSAVRSYSNPFTIPNGLDWWSGRFFFIDTPSHLLCEMEECGGMLLVKDCYTFGSESPDGMCISSSGLCYVALWGSGRVAVVDFDRKREVASYAIPRKNVSSVAFGGDKLDTLLITAGSDESESGAVFCVHVHDTGRLGNRWIRKEK